MHCNKTFVSIQYTFPVFKSSIFNSKSFNILKVQAFHNYEEKFIRIRIRRDKAIRIQIYICMHVL